jgi:hypothetical protein
MSSADPPMSPSFTETLKSSPTVPTDSTTGFSNNIIIIILCGIIFLILLNDNIGNIFRNIALITYNLVMRILALFGLVTGSAINITADLAGDVARTGVDITEGTLHSVGNILTGSNNNQGLGANIQTLSANIQKLGANTQVQQSNLDNTLNNSTVGQQNAQIPNPDTTASPIQNSISQEKNAWCLVGEYKGRRGCIEVSEYDKCMSGQVYPSQKMCLNPALSQNA